MALWTLVLSTASATCPATAAVQAELTCSSSYAGTVDHTATSQLGGDCEDELCYTCGVPESNNIQVAPEAIYSFNCQQSGDVVLRITDLPCDLDIYVLDSSCDPYVGCVEGSTAAYSVDDTVQFTCIEGETYYVVVEAYGTDHLEQASGPCVDTNGDVFSPTYTLDFDVSASTGCNEDCDDGIDNDLDGALDCADSDCGADAVCCDLDSDGFFGYQCDGDDCDDANADVYPGAPELEDGVDNNCDGTVDEGTNAGDDDADGFSENEGDCDDNNASIHPDATDIPDNGVDEDCDGSDATGLGATQEPGRCGCSNSTSGTMALLPAAAVLLLRRRRD